MAWIIGGVIEALVSFLLGIIGQIMSFFTGMIGDTFGTDPDAFMQIFPIVDDFHVAFIAIGYALCILLFLLGCMRNMFSGFGFAGEKPFNMAVRLIAGLFLIYFLGDFLNLLYASSVGSGSSIFGAMYDAIDKTEDLSGSPIGAIWGDANISKFLAYVTTGGFSQIVKAIVCLVLLSVIAINYVKLLLEMFERYLLVNLIIFFAPLSASSIVLESTGKIFSSYLKMYFGQIMTLFMNLISVRIIDSSMGVAAAAISDSSKVTALDGVGDYKPYIILLVIIAMLKVLQRMDNYMRDIGLTVGVTGGAMFDDIYGASKAVSGMVKGVSGGKKAAGKAASVGKAAAGASSFYSDAPSFMGKQVSFANGGLVGGILGKMTDTKNAYKMKRDPASPFRDADYATRVAAATAARTGNGGIASKFGNSAENAAAGSIASMMKAGSGKESMVSKAGSKSAATRTAFGEFQSSLKPVEGNKGSVGTSSLRDVQVGYGGALGMDSNGDLIGISTEPPKYEGAGVEQYTGEDGSSYYVQNLTQANEQYKATHGENYSGFDNAVVAYKNDNDTNFTGMTGDIKQFKGEQTYQPRKVSVTSGETETSGVTAKGNVGAAKTSSAKPNSSAPVKNQNQTKPEKYK